MINILSRARYKIQSQEVKPFFSIIPRWLDIIIIILLSLSVYMNSLKGGFVWDDIPQVSENPFIRDLRNIPSFFTVDLGRYTAYPGFSPYYRPLFLISYTIDYALWGLNPFGYHVSNILLHALSSLLVYIIALRSLGERTAAFIAGSIFAVHPVHAEVVAWIAGRADLLASSLLFISFYLYTIFRDKGRKLFLCLSIIAYTLSIFSKEMAISLPLLLLAYEFSSRQPVCCSPGREKGHRNIASKFLWPLLYIIISGLYFILRISIMGSIVLERPDAPPLSTGRIYATFGVVIDYLRLFVFPINLKVLYHIPLKDSIFDPQVLFSILFLIIILTGVFFTYRKDRRIFFASLWFLITILPVLGPAGLVLMADRYLYIPSLGLCLLGGLFLSKIYHLSSKFRVRSSKFPNISWSRYINLLILLPLIFLFIITFQRNTIWKDEFTYYKKAVEDAPGFAMAHNNLGLWYLSRKMYDEAIPTLKKATELDPMYPYSRVNLGNAYLQKGLYKEAIAEFRKVIAIRPNFAEAYYSLGNAYREMGRMDEAIAHWQMTLRFKPEHSESNNNLGNVYLLQGNYREAAERYKVALKGRPLNIEAYYNLGIALERLGEINDAVSHYKKFIELAPEEYKEQVEEVRKRILSLQKDR